MSKKLETIFVSLEEDAHLPTFVVCYGRSTTFRVEGVQDVKAEVDQGSRSVVHRSLCVSKPYGPKCEQCPRRTFTIAVESRGYG